MKIKSETVLSINRLFLKSGSATIEKNEPETVPSDKLLKKVTVINPVPYKPLFEKDFNNHR